MNWPIQAADADAAFDDVVAAAADGGDEYDGVGDGVTVARGTRPGSVTTRTTPVMAVAAPAAKRGCVPTSRPSWSTRARCGTGSGLMRRSMARGMAHPRCHRRAMALTCLNLADGSQ
jgi:hypothetical protein